MGRAYSMNRVDLGQIRIIRIVKSRRIRLAGHVAQMGKKRNNAYRILM
jgi:hypothetical protein